jgi:AraC-like DNA-binding protein
MTSVFTHIYLLASVQGFLLAILLFTRKKNHAANTVLGLLVGALSLDLLQANYTFNHLYEVYPHLMGITYVFPFLYGPLFYLYARLLTSEKRKLEWKNVLHFLPAFLILVYASPVYFLTGPEKIDFISLMNTDRPLEFSIIDNLKPIHGFIYTILVIRVIARHNRRIRDAFSNIDLINLLWLRSLTIGVAIIWSIVVGSVLSADLFNLHFSGFDFAIYFCISILIYTIGYMGLKQPEVFQQANVDVRQRSDRGMAEGEPSRYVKSGLSDSSADGILTRLRELMELKKPYLDGDLTLGKLAEMLSISPHNLSEAMNTRLNQSFYDYVNSYRVSQVKRRLQGGDAEQYSFLAIAYDSGFTSKSSFNTIFKKQTGMTPSQFIDLQATPSLSPAADTARPGETE